MTGVSLCMTVYNEAETIEAFLDSILLLDRLPDELVIADGGSDDDTVVLIRQWAKTAGIDTVVLDGERLGISAGRNRAIGAARSDWIAVTDAGTVVDRRWLSELHQYMTDDIDVVAGFFQPIIARGVQGYVGASTTPLLREISPAQFLPSSRSVAFRSQAWRAVGGYPEWLDYCEDLVFDLALKAHGARFVFAPGAIVSWDSRGSWRDFYTQYYRYARGDGKAGLWPRRHALRYGAYATGAALAVATFISGSPLPATLAGLGFLAYTARYFKRVVARRKLMPHFVLAILAVPLVAVVGDVAKMLGYPMGVLWRTRMATTGPERP